jgi:pyruvate,water dikinase
MAVILQEMIPAEISGVCFTTNPISGNKNEIMIEFCEGLGVPLVSSQIVPHMYIINKTDSTIVEYRCGTQKRVMRYGENSEILDVNAPLQVKSRELSKSQIEKIVEMAIILENIFETAQDFEWTLVGTELTVVQSRNITT